MSTQEKEKSDKKSECVQKSEKSIAKCNEGEISDCGLEKKRVRFLLKIVRSKVPC